jgi:hypothetical protein
MEIVLSIVFVIAFLMVFITFLCTSDEKRGEEVCRKETAPPPKARIIDQWRDYD